MTADRMRVWSDLMQFVLNAPKKYSSYSPLTILIDLTPANATQEAIDIVLTHFKNKGWLARYSTWNARKDYTLQYLELQPPDGWMEKLL